jgi:hypothetical protein
LELDEKLVLKKKHITAGSIIDERQSQKSFLKLPINKKGSNF